jgi:hypothetical protein
MELRSKCVLGVWRDGSQQPYKIGHLEQVRLGECGKMEVSTPETHVLGYLKRWKPASLEVGAPQASASWGVWRDGSQQPCVMAIVESKTFFTMSVNGVFWQP